MKLEFYLTTYQKINAKLTKDLNLRPQLLKLLEENIRKDLLDVSLGNDFLDMTPKVQATKTNEQMDRRRQKGLRLIKKLLQLPALTSPSWKPLNHERQVEEEANAQAEAQKKGK